MKAKFLPPTYFVALLILSIVTHFLFPIKKLIYPPFIFLGIIFIIMGGILNLWADSVFKKEKTTVKPNEKPNRLITSGPFLLSRHPMYLGFFLIMFGASIIMGSLVSFVFPFIFIIIIELFFIPIEEKNLKEVFGEEYSLYRKKVRPWI